MILCALRREARAVRRCLRDGGRGPIEVVVTGMGPLAARAALQTRLAAQPPPAGVVLAGLAGSCTGDLPAGTLLIATAVLSPEGDRLVCDPELVAAALVTVSKLALPVVSGLVATRSRVVDLRRDGQELAAAGVLAVEMEGYPLAMLCREAGVPFLMVRAVLDTPARSLRGLDGLVPPLGATGPTAGQLLRVAINPTLWVRALRMLKTARQAETAAARAAVAVQNAES